jgi:nucleoside-diphosphate-sugar epimerase
MKVVIFGCGYVGKVLARLLIERGDPVRATTTTEARLSQLVALGAEPTLLRTTVPESFKKALSDAEAVVHLAPPGEDEVAAQVQMIANAVNPKKLKAYVYGSSTGAFGVQADEQAWVDESTPSGELPPRGRARVDFELALRGAGLPVRVVRIAGIYGPGRTLRESIERSALILFRDGPVTSRIHVEDLSRMLMAMLEKNAPPMAIACDELPATMLDVAAYTCQLLDRPLPDPIPLEDARRVLSPQALELRLGGHRCRSLVRDELIGSLQFPSYREGIRASLEAEGMDFAQRV